jgi:hypothetical protein
MKRVGELIRKSKAMDNEEKNHARGEDSQYRDQQATAMENPSDSRVVRMELPRVQVRGFDRLFKQLESILGDESK